MLVILKAINLAVREFFLKTLYAVDVITVVVGQKYMTEIVARFIKEFNDRSGLRGVDHYCGIGLVVTQNMNVIIR